MGAAALTVAVGAIAARAAGVGSVEAYPRFELALGLAEVLLACGLVAAAIAPLAGRSARLGVARA